LSDGDRLRFGPYEIEIHIASDAATPPASRDPFAASLLGASSFTRPRVLDSPPQLTPQSVALHADYDPIAPEPSNPFDELPPQPDHTPSVDEAYRPPPVFAKALPEDWDDFTPSTPEPSPTPVAQPVTPMIPVAQPVTPVTPAIPISAPPPGEDAAPQPLPPQGDLLAAFLRGAGLSEAHPADPALTMEALGAAFRALVSGLRQGLIARAGIKDLFRIERTIIRARGNNPLKFSADDDDALLALLGTGRRTGMGPAEAITDALRDMRLHELATIAAMQNAVRSLLGQMDPARIARENEASMALIPAQRKARAWDAYESLYARIVQALADDFDSVFGKAFARAYEKALGELSSHEGTPQKRTSESHRA
ncbi:MAG: type VI secretion system-associated FHA domain protein TagH, partial [Acetobacteraceae bacterium]|nr:type VI secretion system-associated FHA domain protein TagH [Acetobacteraceae bacterium]